MEFDWDDANLQHISLHGIDPDEVEDVVLDEYACDFPAHRGPKGERRFGVLGKTLSERILLVILEERQTKFRVVTARVAKKKEVSLYDNAKQKYS